MEIKNGVISEIYNDSDYELSGALSVQNLPNAPHKFTDFMIQYHQPDISEMSCTVHGCLTAFSALTGYKFTDEQRREIWELCKNDGASDVYGYYLNKAVDIVRNYVNKLNIGTFVTFRIPLGFDEYYGVIKKGYMVVSGYNGNTKWNQDKNDNGVIDYIDFGTSTYSHIIAHYDPSPDTKNEINFADNYKKTSPFNVYKIPNIIPLYQNNTLFKYGYVFAYNDVEPVLDRKLIEKCKSQFIAIVKPSKDGLKPSGEIFYCNKNSEIITMNSAGYELKYQMLLDGKCIGISKDDLINFKKII